MAALWIFGEWIWLGLLVAAGIWLLRGSRHRVWRGAAVLALAAAAIGHHLGFKLYGRPVLYDNRPVLREPREVAALAAPNMLVMSDGRRIAVEGFRFKQEALDMPMDEVRRRTWSGAAPLHVETSSEPGIPSGVAIEDPVLYWCGNSFFPAFFPGRLPRFLRTDLGIRLVTLGLAEELPPPWDPAIRPPGDDPAEAGRWAGRRAAAARRAP